MSTLTLTNDWDKIFPKDPSISHSKISFTNRFGIELAADLYIAHELINKTSLPAIAISGPFGAVKEQSSGLYAQILAARGFVTLAFDPSYTGESAGTPRNVASPDINTEDFSAAVDFLSLHSQVDASRIGILGICGWGGIALNAAAIDPRIRATVASTMYDMTRVTAYGYNDSMGSSERQALRQQLAEQRTQDAQSGQIARAGGVVDPLPDDAPQFVRDYHAYYKTERGYHARSLNSNEGWNSTSALSFLNAKFLAFTDEIKTPVLVIHGEKAHSRYFSESAFEKLTGDNKELMIIPDASHTDLYDQTDVIPFDAITDFYQRNLSVQ
ncbi:alpha/beta hydrolase [Collinsella sp. zg1085]|uniref:alpha/beta hydrolase n=1 Tax=Collinsella sp. zg1085 TaxID=2844380 RepID=UPI001C0D1F9D|nr:alpha/beta hydrolase [Collinsella sp. zg1085]QWT18199.1 alpha/beta hydrolase [Collinsella sp. zg1085]